MQPCSEMRPHLDPPTHASDLSEAFLFDCCILRKDEEPKDHIDREKEIEDIQEDRHGGSLCRD